MAKLTGAKKKAFLERMAKGRRKAARGNPKKTRSAGDRGTKPGTRKLKSAGKLRGAKKVEFLKRMAKGRRKAATAGNPKKNAKRKNRRRNTEEEARSMYQTFHGKAPGRIVEFEEVVNFPHNFSELGRLVELRIHLDHANPTFPFTGFGNCMVVSTTDGENIYFVGGDQRVDLDSLEIGGDKDMVELGPCVYICYHTTKDFHDFTPIDYFHEFGEENGVTPVLCYDRLNKKLFLIGGDYRVKREGIVN